MAGNEERQRLVPDVGIVQLPTGDRVGGVQHQVEQVALTGADPLTPFPDHTVDQFLHLPEAVLVGPVLALLEPGQQR